MSKITTAYEWTWETTDAHGDITDCGYTATLTECRQESPAGAECALVRRRGNDDEGEVERGYAYCQPSPTGTGLVLPQFFDDGAKVPQKFHAEIAAAYPPA